MEQKWNVVVIANCRVKETETVTDLRSKACVLCALLRQVKNKEELFMLVQKVQ